MSCRPLVDAVFNTTPLDRLLTDYRIEGERVPLSEPDLARIRWGLPVAGLFLLLETLSDFGLGERRATILDDFVARLHKPAHNVRVSELVICRPELRQIAAAGVLKTSLFGSVKDCVVDSRYLLGFVVKYRFAGFSSALTAIKSKRVYYGSANDDRYSAVALVLAPLATGRYDSDAADIVRFLEALFSRIQNELDRAMSDASKST